MRASSSVNASTNNKRTLRSSHHSNSTAPVDKPAPTTSSKKSKHIRQSRAIDTIDAPKHQPDEHMQDDTLDSELQEQPQLLNMDSDYATLNAAAHAIFSVYQDYESLPVLAASSSSTPSLASLRKRCLTALTSLSQLSLYTQSRQKQQTVVLLTQPVLKHIHSIHRTLALLPQGVHRLPIYTRDNPAVQHLLQLPTTTTDSTPVTSIPVPYVFICLLQDLLMLGQHLYGILSSDTHRSTDKSHSWLRVSEVTEKYIEKVSSMFAPELEQLTEVDQVSLASLPLLASIQHLFLAHTAAAVSSTQPAASSKDEEQAQQAQQAALQRILSLDVVT